MAVNMKCSANEIRKSLNDAISESKPHIDRIVQEVLDKMHDIFFEDTKKMLTSHYFSHEAWYDLVHDKVLGGREYNEINKEELPELFDEIELVERKITDELTKNGFRVFHDKDFSEDSYVGNDEYRIIWGISENDCKEVRV